MTSVGSMVQAFTAVNGSGSVIAQQTNFADELATKIEEIGSAAEEMKVTLQGEVNIQGMIEEYFREFAEFLAKNESPNDAQLAIIESTEELIEMTRSIDEVLNTFITYINGGLEHINSVKEICNGTVNKANDLAGQISASANPS